jgi:hypothetical protein
MTQLEMVKDPQRYFDLLTDDSVEVQNVRFVNEEIVEVHYVHSDDFIPANAKTNAVIAAFTTAHARLKLYSVLEQLNERVLYFDTGIRKTLNEFVQMNVTILFIKYMRAEKGIRIKKVPSDTKLLFF